MKRSAAPSNTHPSGASKKMKPTKVVESSVVNKEIKTLKVVAKSGPPPPINAKQQKPFTICCQQQRTTRYWKESRTALTDLENYVLDIIMDSMKITSA